MCVCFYTILTGSAESVNELVSRVMEVGSVHFHSAPLYAVDNQHRVAAKTLLRSALQLAQVRSEIWICVQWNVCVCVCTV